VADGRFRVGHRLIIGGFSTGGLGRMARWW
jgi:hypothetical protein